MGRVAELGSLGILEPVVTKDDTLQLIGQFLSVLGWMCLGFAVMLGAGMFIHQDGSRSGAFRAAYELRILRAIPILIAASGVIQFFARPLHLRIGSWTFWILFLIAVLFWTVALVDLSQHGDLRGWRDALGL